MRKYQALLLLSRFSCVWLHATPETAANQAPPSPGFSRQEHWSGLPFPYPMHECEKWKWSHSVVSDSQWAHGPQPTRLLHPWDLLGKSTGVGCHCLLQALVLLKTSQVLPIYCQTWITLATSVVLKIESYICINYGDGQNIDYWITLWNFWFSCLWWASEICFINSLLNDGSLLLNPKWTLLWPEMLTNKTETTTK